MTPSTRALLPCLLLLALAPAAAASDDARVVASDLPAQLQPGEARAFALTVRNTGSTTWSRDAGFKLGAIGDSDPFYPQPRVWLPAGVQVLPGQTHTFQAVLTAPALAGTYTTDWRMVHEGVRWFGGSLVKQVVVAGSGGGEGDQAQLVSARLPTSLAPGAGFQAEVVLRNSGTSTWTPEEGFKLGAAGDSDPFFPGVRVRLPAGARVPPGSSHAFRFTLTAPPQDGTHTTDWRMVHEGVRWFGATASQRVRVGDGGGPEFKLIVTSYPWIGPNRGPVSLDSVRYPARSDPATDRYQSQATPEYGQYLADLCNAHEIDIISGYWQIVRDGTMNRFQASFPPRVRLGRLRLVYMAGLLGFEDPADRRTIEATLKSWREDAQDRTRYGTIQDASGETRPIIMLWGAWANAFGAELEAMIDRVRAHFRAAGPNPFFIMTQHGLDSGDQRIIRSMDAFYRHSCPIPQVGQVWSTAESQARLEPLFQRYARDLTGATNRSTGLPIAFLPGTMPQFDRHLLEVNYEGGAPTHGIVRAGSKGEVVSMFELVRQFAPTLGGGHRWGVITSLNEWAEGSTIEPTQAMGPKYGPTGHYRRDLVDAVREVFGRPLR